MASKLILIVDDSDDVRFVFGAILNYDGYRVLEASDGQDGVEKAREHKPDLILMDISMPTMDGVTAAKLIRAEPGIAQTPIVAVTGENLKSGQYAPGAALFNHCFSKPLSPARVLEEVQRMIGPAH